MRTDLTNEQYHAHPAISSSDVKAVFKTSLAHWKGKVRKPSTAFAMGSAVHALVLEPEKNLVLRGPEDRRGNRWKEAQLAADLDGRILLTEADFDLAERIAEATRAHPIMARYLADDTFIAEASFFATDPDTGVEIKCRPDGYLKRSGILFDVKTTRDASPEGFPREIRNYGYDLQAAHYLRCVRAAGYAANSFIFIAVEKDAPFAVGVHNLSEEYISDANMRVINTLAMIRDAETISEWTTGWPMINTVDLPRWQATEPEIDVYDDQIDF